MSRTEARIAVIGQGAIGRLVADALAGSVEVVRVDRSRSPAPAIDEAVDFALICVKTPGTAWAAAAARRLLKPDGVGVTLQNGLGNLEILAAALGGARACAGSVHTGAYREGDRVVATGPLRLSLARGEAGGSIETLAALLRTVGAEVTLVDRAAPLLWRKVVVSAALNPLTAILGLPNGALPDHAAGALLADALAREAARVAVAAVAGIALAEADAVRLWREAAGATATNLSSMLQDVRAHRVTEIDSICGAIAREGARTGVPAPLNAAMSLLIQALEPTGYPSTR